MDELHRRVTALEKEVERLEEESRLEGDLTAGMLDHLEHDVEQLQDVVHDLQTEASLPRQPSYLEQLATLTDLKSDGGPDDGIC